MAAAPKKLAAPTAVERAVIAVREGIRDGRYALGQRLVESELTEALGISRGPLREAMWRLAGEGLVSIETNRGVVVRRLSHQDLTDMYEIRELIEGLAARRAAERITEGDNRGRLEAAKRTGERAQLANDVNRYMDANEAFHDLIVEISGNEPLKGLIAQLRLPIFRLQFQRMLKPGAAAKSVSEHGAIFDAIVSGDGARAERAMRQHVRASGKLLQKLLADAQ